MAKIMVKQLKIAPNHAPRLASAHCDEEALERR
jgi:hypothetical protein